MTQCDSTIPTDLRARWFARYGDDYATPELAEADYAEYLAARELARSIMGPVGWMA